MDSQENVRIWRAGPPPHIGWWNASLGRNPRAWRWWDGQFWSKACFAYHSLRAVGRRAASRMSAAASIEWNDYWPENARVPRIDPRPVEVRIPMLPVEHDLLPAVGSKVLIHLTSCDKWVEHTVVGYYVWGNLGSDKGVHRVFVRVRDAEGYLNARLLNDVRPVAPAKPVVPLHDPNYIEWPAQRCDMDDTFMRAVDGRG